MVDYILCFNGIYFNRKKLRIFSECVKMCLVFRTMILTIILVFIVNVTEVNGTHCPYGKGHFECVKKKLLQLHKQPILVLLKQKLLKKIDKSKSDELSRTAKEPELNEYNDFSHIMDLSFYTPYNRHPNRW